MFNNPEYDKAYNDGVGKYVVSGSGITAIDHIKLMCIFARLIRAFKTQSEKTGKPINIPLAICKIAESQYVTLQTIRPFVFMAYDIAMGEGELPDFGLKTLPDMASEIKRIIDNYLPF